MQPGRGPERWPTELTQGGLHRHVVHAGRGSGLRSASCTRCRKEQKVSTGNPGLGLPVRTFCSSQKHAQLSLRRPLALPALTTCPCRPPRVCSSSHGTGPLPGCSVAQNGQGNLRLSCSSQESEQETGKAHKKSASAEMKNFNSPGLVTCFGRCRSWTARGQR